MTLPVGQEQALVLPLFACCTWQRVLDGRCTAAGGASHGALVWWTLGGGGSGEVCAGWRQAHGGLLFHVLQLCGGGSGGCALLGCYHCEQCWQVLLGGLSRARGAQACGWSLHARCGVCRGVGLVCGCWLGLDPEGVAQLLQGQSLVTA